MIGRLFRTKRNPPEEEPAAIIQPDHQAFPRTRPWYGFGVCLWMFLLMESGLIYGGWTGQIQLSPAGWVGTTFAMFGISAVIGWWVRRAQSKSFILVARSAVVVSYGATVEARSDGPEDTLIVEAARSGKCWLIYWKSRPRKRIRASAAAYPGLPEIVQQAMARLSSGGQPDQAGEKGDADVASEEP